MPVSVANEQVELLAPPVGGVYAQPTDHPARAAVALLDRRDPPDAGQGPLVSVVMSTFREVADGRRGDAGDSSLAQAIDSVVAQSYPHWELLIVSDHPPASDVEHIRALAERYGDRRICHYDMAQRGGTAAPGARPKAAGVALARGSLLAFLDADNQWAKPHLSRAVRALTSERAPDLVYCDALIRLAPTVARSPLDHLSALYFGLGLLVADEFAWQKPDWSARSRELLGRINFIDSSEAVMRRDAYLAADGLQERHNYDWWLWKHMIAAGQDRFEHLPQIGLYYTTASLQSHFDYFVLSLIEKSGLPIDWNMHEQVILDSQNARYQQKYPV